MAPVMTEIQPATLQGVTKPKEQQNARIISVKLNIKKRTGRKENCMSISCFLSERITWIICKKNSQKLRTTSSL
jgi:hypothetical protein